jgi:hypothetical protein
MTVVRSARPFEFDDDNWLVSSFAIKRQRPIEDDGNIRFAGTGAVGQERREGLVRLQVGIERQSIV